jgi:hypothetical protein
MGGLPVRGEMAWKVCKSENVQEFERELTTSLPDLNGVKLSPVYACQSVLVCLRSSSFPRATFSQERSYRFLGDCPLPRSRRQALTPPSYLLLFWRVILERLTNDLSDSLSSFLRAFCGSSASGFCP